MKQKQKRKRDQCSNCKRNGTNPTGHTDEYCAYAGGKFQGEFKKAIAAGRAARLKPKASTPAIARQSAQQPATATATEPVVQFLDEATGEKVADEATNAVPHWLEEMTLKHETTISDLKTTFEARIYQQQQQIDDLKKSLEAAHGLLQGMHRRHVREDEDKWASRPHEAARRHHESNRHDSHYDDHRYDDQYFTRI